MASRICRLRGWLAAGAMLAVVAALAGCDSDAATRVDQGGSDSGAGASVPTSVAFDPATTLTLAPGVEHTLRVIAKPPASYPVRFALIGEAGNASLDHSEVDSSTWGVVEVGLTAPTTPATFRVRASVGTGTGTGTSAEVAVSVSAGGFATLVVHPEYKSKRTVTGSSATTAWWVAGVRAGITCASLIGIPPPDGDLTASSGFFQDPQITSVPVGPALAVTVRARHFAGGCVDLQTLTAGQINTVIVPVVDRPIQLDQTHLTVDLGIDTLSPGWAQVLSSTIDETANAMLDGSAGDVAALLDSMQVALGQSPDAAAFAQARTVGQWNAVLTATFGSTASQAVRSPVKTWLTAGATNIGGAHTFVARLNGQGQDAGTALLTLSSIAGLAPGSVGSPTNVGPVSWSADPGDTVLLGAKLSWMPSLLVTALALAPAQKDVPAATSVPEALADQIDCTAIGSALASAGAKPAEAYPGCDAACAAALCGNGLVVMWNRARDSSASHVEAATLDISATGAADVDDQARPESFKGSWVGKLRTGQTTLSVGGPATGSPSPPPP